MKIKSRTMRQQRGFTLTEALVAFSITGGGLLAVAGFQGDLIADSAYNKARTEALSLAQQKIEEFRHYTHADETNYVDEDGDGVMDPDGPDADPPINGQNAVFTRSWDLATGDQSKQIDVTVSWPDSSNVVQSVSLEAALPWISPRSGADQISIIEPPALNAPTGRAERGEGELADYPNVNPVPVSGPGDDGLSTYQNEENLLLVDGADRVLLTLLDACNTDTGQCSAFVKISGTVYLDTDNTTQDAEDTFVVASDAAHCQRWVPGGGSLAAPPTTANGDYEYFNYTCYLGGGWHGNVGFVTSTGVQQTDKVCQGDPTSFNAWEEPVIALRRVYRGMLSYTSAGVTYYESHGIKDAIELTGHDFVFTQLAVSDTEGSHCEGADAPMTRTDSLGGALFTGVPTDFFCLNADDNNDGVSDYLDGYDANEYSANTTCPYDPTDPPVSSYSISGVVSVVTGQALDLSAFEVTTSDGPGNCSFVSPFASVVGGYDAVYECTVYDWGTGWSGYVQAVPNSNQLYCPDDAVDFDDVIANQDQIFTCFSSNTIYIRGALNYGDRAEPITEIVATNADTLEQGFCKLGAEDYRCMVPYDGAAANLTLTVTAADAVCGSLFGIYTFAGLDYLNNPHSHDIFVMRREQDCP